MPDLEKERSEKILSIEEFLIAYNTNLPKTFPQVSLHSLMHFNEANQKLFKDNNDWTLGKHRKRVMDWLPRYIHELSK